MSKPQRRRIAKIEGDEREAFYSFMDGYSGMIPEDAPDGAWQEMCKEGVRAFNRTYGKNYDPHDGWLLWVERLSMNSSRQE